MLVEIIEAEFVTHFVSSVRGYVTAFFLATPTALEIEYGQRIKRSTHVGGDKYILNFRQEI
jgi:hypothetical protein